jgi:hypothetical protein
MKLRKIVSTALIGAMLFFAPSTIPAPLRAQSLSTPCGGTRILSGWLPMDTAFAGVAPRVTPCPVGHSHTPVWPWVVIGCAGSIVLSALVANFRDNRQLTTPEAWTCGLLYWIPMPYQGRPAAAVHAKG